MEEGRGGERRSAAACTTACKNDRALTRYKSHYDVNLLDPSPPTDFQPPGTVLGYGLWATSHANSDEVAPSLSLSLSLSISPFLHPPVPSSSFAPSCLLLSLQPPIRLFQSLSFRLSGFIRKPIPTPSHRGAPSLHGPEPGNICPRDICVLIESPISSLIERTIGRSLSLSLRFQPTGCPLITLFLSPFPSDSRVSADRFVESRDRHPRNTSSKLREIFAIGYVATLLNSDFSLPPSLRQDR